MTVNHFDFSPTSDKVNKSTSDNTSQNTSGNTNQNTSDNANQSTSSNRQNPSKIKPIYIPGISKPDDLFTYPLFIPGVSPHKANWVDEQNFPKYKPFFFPDEESDCLNNTSSEQQSNLSNQSALVDTADKKHQNTDSNSKYTLPCTNNPSLKCSDQTKNTSVGKTDTHKSAEQNPTILPVNFSSVIHSIGDYIYKDGDLLYLDPESQKEFLIGNIWLTIKKEICYMTEIVNEHNDIVRYDPHTKWLIDIECMNQNFSVEVTVNELYDHSKLLKFTADRACMEATADSRRYFKKYINRLISRQDFFREYCFNSTGWKKTEKGWFYLTDLGFIGVNNSPYKANVDYHFEYCDNQVDTLKTFSVFHAMRNLSSRKMENTVFLMHYSCLSVMTTLFQETGHGINFVVALIGTTNSQKTATANIFTRLYNRTAKSSADIRFDSTKAAILEKTSTYGDSILMIDDILPYDDITKMKQQNAIVTDIIRAYGDRTPRMRSEAYAKINDVAQYNAIKGCCLITGELLDIGFESTATRIIRLDFDRGDINLEQLTFYQNNLMNLPTFMYGYIRFITENIDRVFATIKYTFKDIRKQDFPANMAARYIDTIAIMHTEITIFYTYAVEKGFLEPNEATIYRNFDMQCIEKIVMKNYADAQIQSPAATILLALKQAIEKQTIGYYCFNNKLTKNVLNTSALFDDSFLYIRSATLWEVYKNYCHEMHRSLTYRNERELVKPLAKENVILQKEENGSLRSSHKITAITSARFFMIHKDVFEKYCGSFEDF